MANDFRKGDLATYKTQWNIDPLQFTYSPSPLAGLSSAALQFGSQGLGQALAKSVKL